ncbi:MAG TPA: N-acetylmuramic acid 6-phosphate etherase [Cellulomonas sp.]
MTDPAPPPEDLGALVTESADPRTAELDRLSTLEAARVMNEGDLGVAAAVGRVLAPVAEAADRAAAGIRRGGRLVYLGAGTPGRLGVLDASECPPTFGTDPSAVVALIAGGPAALTRAVEGAEDDADAGAREVGALAVGPDDVLVAVSASGRTPYVLGGLRAAGAAGAWTVAVTANPGSAAGDLARTAIDVVVGPEVIAGSTRLRAGTAQKLVLNMISTLTMVRLGATYGNRMVDLRATNAKLHDRAARIVRDLTDRPDAEVGRALDAADGSAKLAVLLLRTGLTPGAGRALLDRHGGSLRAALGTAPSR